jgi:hypothetical protein
MSKLLAAAQAATARARLALLAEDRAVRRRYPHEPRRPEDRYAQEPRWCALRDAYEAALTRETELYEAAPGPRGAGRTCRKKENCRE